MQSVAIRCGLNNVQQFKDLRSAVVILSGGDLDFYSAQEQLDGYGYATLEEMRSSEDADRCPPSMSAILVAGLDEWFESEQMAVAEAFATLGVELVNDATTEFDRLKTAAEALEAKGWLTRVDISNLSGSTYVECTKDGAFHKIRLSDHDLPAKYGYQRQELTADFRSVEEAIAFLEAI